MNKNKKPTKLPARFSSWMDRNKKLILIVLLILALTYICTVKIIASTKMSYYGDEPDDIALIVSDLSYADEFFKNSASADQARLQNLIALPFVLMFKFSALIPLRILHIFLYLAYLYILFKLFSLKFSKIQATFGVGIVAFSAYMFSFSIFSVSTGNTLANLLGTWVIYYYLDKFAGKSKPTENQIILLGVIAGLSVGARFFNAIILVAILIYDTYLNRGAIFKGTKLGIWNNIFVKLNSLFLICLVLINLLPIQLVYKSISVVILIILYAFLMMNEYEKKYLVQLKSKQTTFVAKWLAIGLTSISVALISSPIHLNFNNIYKLSTWSSKWHHSQNYVNPSRFDIFTIIGVKLGVFAASLIVLSLLFIVLNKKIIQFFKDYALILMITLFHLIVFIWVKFVIAWYPLFIMPFLYLPLIYVFPKDFTRINRPLTAMVVAVLLFVPVVEQYRYWKLFPYGQIDGAQFGENYIGWNKPGMITFEGMNIITEYFKGNSDNLVSGLIDCEVARGLFTGTKWAPRVMNMTLNQAGVYDFECKVKEDDESYAEYAFTTMYTDGAVLNKINQEYKLKNQFYEAGIPFAKFWIKK